MDGSGNDPVFLPIRTSPQDEGVRLDVFLAKKFRCSRSTACQRLRDGVFDESGRALKLSHRLRKGETIQVRTRIRPEPQVPVEFRLLFNDEFLVAVDKGAGAPVHPVRAFRTRTVLTVLKEQLGAPELRPAHRLDRETSGVLLFARTVPVVSALMRQFALGMVRKRYLAVVRGSPPFERRRVELPLCLDPSFSIRCRMKVDERVGRPAVTDFEVLARHGERTLVAAVPRTGRQHQIRVHLAALGFPVVGDKLYQEGGRPYLDMIRDRLGAATLARLGHSRQALHAERLQFDHPVSGERMLLLAPLPEDLRALLD